MEKRLIRLRVKFRFNFWEWFAVPFAGPRSLLSRWEDTVSKSVKSLSLGCVFQSKAIATGAYNVPSRPQQLTNQGTLI